MIGDENKTFGGYQEKSVRKDKTEVNKLAGRAYLLLEPIDADPLDSAYVPQPLLPEWTAGNRHGHQKLQVVAGCRWLAPLECRQGHLLTPNGHAPAAAVARLVLMGRDRHDDTIEIARRCHLFAVVKKCL